MTHHSDSEDVLSGSDSDDGFDNDFNQDMEALRRACTLTATHHIASSSSSAAADNINNPHGSGGASSTFPSTSDSDSEDDIEMARNICRRLAVSTDVFEPLMLKPLCSVPRVESDDDYEDDLETLRVIQRRFVAYNDASQRSCWEDYSPQAEQVGAPNTLEKGTSNNLFVEKTNAREGFPNSVDASDIPQNKESLIENVVETKPPCLIEWHESGDKSVALLPDRDSGFPKSAQAFVDAIKKNRACQKFVRSKMLQIEARIEQIKKLQDRVKILKDFQSSCRKRTGRALSQKKDARVQLISVPKSRTNCKLNEKKVPAMLYGPAENSHVAAYKMALSKFPVSFKRGKWSKHEQENLEKGIKQQLQEMLLQRSVDLFSADGSSGDSNDFDNIMTSISDLHITPETIRSFLPKVNWERLASMYVVGHSGAECQARWLNCEDPLIDHTWTKMDDKNLFHVIQEKGIDNWIDIAVSLGPKRTPFDCLKRYQRSLNSSMLKSEWTEAEDDKLRAAVEAFGEGNWQHVASALEGRTGTQCSNRWIKSLHPARMRVGKWDLDEDKRLQVAVMLFGPKSWNRIAQFVPGRTQVQCRERWVNCLDPSLKWDAWTEEEDVKLKKAIADHGYCWSKVAACVPPRTDNQCRRRWERLFPHEVPLLQNAKRIQKAALISNFVDRESERPALGPGDFISLLPIGSNPEPENVKYSGKRKKLKRKLEHNNNAENSSFGSEEVLRLTDGGNIKNFGTDATLREKGVRKLHSRNKETLQDSVLVCPDTLLPMSNGEGLASLFHDETPKKRASCGQKRKLRDSPQSVENVTASSTKTPLSEAALEEVGLGGKDTGNKRKAVKPRTRGKFSGHRNMHQLLPSSTSVMEAEAGHSGMDLESVKGNERLQSTSSTPDIQDCSNSRISQFCPPKRPKKPFARDPNCSSQTSTINDGDNMTISAFLQQVRGSQNSMDDNSDDVNIAAFGGHEVHHKSASLPQNVAKLHSSERPVRNHSLLVEDAVDDGNTIASIVCRQRRRKVSKTEDKALQMPELEDGDSMTLASFRKKLKGSRRQVA